MKTRRTRDFKLQKPLSKAENIIYIVIALILIGAALILLGCSTTCCWS